jgi:phosphoserine phosphatase
MARGRLWLSEIETGAVSGGAGSPATCSKATHMTTIILTRHGHVNGIQPRRFRGREDLTLTQRGEAEAGAVAEYIAARWRPTRVYTSPLRRCVATGAAIASACHVEAVVLGGLNDLDYGSWQFKPYEEVEQTDARLFAEWFAAPHLVRFPGGESLQDLVARSADALLPRRPARVPLAVA